jgi:hypothetical protein
LHIDGLAEFLFRAGAGSFATTSMPRARIAVAQLASMTPVPTIATRVM